VLFAATATKGLAARMVATTLEFSAHVGTVVAPSPTVMVLDVNGNGVPNVAVTFTVTSGGGALDGVGTLATLTDATGSAKVNWTVGPAAGSNTLQATAEGLQGSPIRFGAITFACDCWMTKASMPTARTYLGVAAINGILYAVGGHITGGAGGAILATLEAYDPASNTWTTKAPMPTARYLLATAAVNGVLYAVGGTNSQSGNSDLATVEAYDPASDTWTTKAPMPTARFGFRLAAINGILYAVGGNIANVGVQATVEAYDPATDTWTTKASMPTARSYLGLAAINGILYAVGGATNGGSVGTVEAYDPAADTWTTQAPMPTAREQLTADGINGVLYAVGGDLGGTSTLYATLEAYDPATNTWTTKTPMPAPRAALASTPINGIFYAVGGVTSLGPVATMEAYQP
jgi:N-acetylneuraminic acid mutarotase